MLPFDPAECRLEPSKHFRNTKMRKWGWSYEDLREALGAAYRVDRKGRRKLEVWVRRDGSKKLVVAYERGTETVFVITGTEG